MRVIVSILVLLSATASCIRSIVVEETTIWNPDTSVRQNAVFQDIRCFTEACP